MSQPPAVTVLMPIYNSRPFITGAVTSVLEQTYGDFELLAMDDGSDDGSSEYLHALTDPRVVIHRNDTNMGLTHCLKHGLRLSRGRYIARLDSDDVAKPDRLERQVAFLERHPEVAILGSDFYLCDEKGVVRGKTHVPTNDLHIRWTSLLRNPFAHSTVMLRAEMLRENDLSYDEAFPSAQDYELWTRLMAIAPGANLPFPLVTHRVHSTSVTSTRPVTQRRHRDVVALRTIGRTLPGHAISEVLVSQMRSCFEGGPASILEPEIPLATLASSYVELWKAFKQRYRNAAGLLTLERQVTTAVAWGVARAMIRGRPGGPGTVRTVCRLMAMNPVLPFHVLCRAATAIPNRLRWPLVVE